MRFQVVTGHLAAGIYLSASRRHSRASLCRSSHEAGTRDGGKANSTIARGSRTRVAAFDIRGIGDLWPEVGRGNPFYTRRHAGRRYYAWASLILGKPLLGQRVSDILAIVQALRNHGYGMRGSSSRPSITSRFRLCFAAAIDPKSRRYTPREDLPPMRACFETEDYTEPFANFIPDVLSKTRSA